MSQPYAVEVPVINVTEQARREGASVWRTLLAFTVTIRHLINNLFRGDSPTISYPEQTRPYSERFRGTHILTVRDDGSLKCVACYMCATACPAFCIHIVAGEHPDPNIEKFPVTFEIEMDKCVFCGFCEEACPVDAIRLTPEPRMADYQRERMLYDKTYLLSWNPTYVEEEHRYPGGAPRDE